MADGRITQLVAETLTHPTPDARVSQLIAETLTSTTAVARPDARVTQIVAETLTLGGTDPPPVRVSQAPVETVQQFGVLGARVSQAPVETVQQFRATVQARVSHAVVELLYRFDGVCHPPLTVREDYPLLPVCSLEGYPVLPTCSLDDFPRLPSTPAGPAVLTNIAVTTTYRGPVGRGRNVLAYDLTTGALVATCDLNHGFFPQSILYRPSTDDFLVASTGTTAGGLMHRLDRAFTLLETVVLALPPFPAGELWRIKLVRADFHGGLYIAYTPSVGPAFGDQFLRKIDPVTFMPLQDWHTFLPRDGRSFTPADFSLDGTRVFFAMIGGPALDQNVIYRLPLAASLAAPFTAYGTYSGGTNPTGNTYADAFLRPRQDGTYVAAVRYLRGTDGNVLNELVLIAADGAILAHYPLDPTLPQLTHMHAVSGLAVDGPTAWFVTDNAILARMNLTTGVQTTILPADENGLVSIFIDLVVLRGSAAPSLLDFPSLPAASVVDLPPLPSEDCMDASTFVCNLALAEIGITNTITNLADDVSQEASLARLVYSDVLDTVLRDHPWKFATEYAALAWVEGSRAAPVNPDWIYTYLLPEDCVRVRRVCDPSQQRRYTATPVPFDQRANADGTRDVLLCNEPGGGLLPVADPLTLTVEYTKRLACAAQVNDAQFREALTYKLAARLAKGLARDSKDADRCLRNYLTALPKAQVQHGNTSQVQEPSSGSPDWMRGRE